jgi:von Willebrand factor type A domain
MSEALNQVDLCFVVDTTGSMGPFIQSAQQRLLETIEALGSDHRVDLWLGLVEYRDHPPQDHSFVTRTNALTPDRGRIRQAIDALKADGGGDAPEAVYDGVHAACSGMAWRAHSARFALLIGDAPPHGFRRRGISMVARERDSTGHCPCGLTVQAVTAAAENARVVVHALCMGAAPITREAFAEIASGTGGHSSAEVEGNAVLERIVETLSKEFADLRFDAAVLDTARRLETLDPDGIAAEIGEARLPVSAAIARLGRRGLFQPEGR